MKKVLSCAIFIILFITSTIFPKHQILPIKKYKQQEKKIIIGIPSYCNKNWYKYNLDSVFKQQYSNYEVIYIDDCSPDGTADLVMHYVKECGQEHRVTVIRNRKRRLALANHYTIIHRCPDNAILVTLDGDDWLINNRVLAYINKVYDDPNVWMTYGQYINWPINTLGPCKPFSDECVQKNNYRNEPWVFGHLRTCYAWLAKQIKLEDLLFPSPPLEGKFFPSGCDNALLYPLIEMTGGKYKCISNVLYSRNVYTPLNDHKVDLQLQRHCGELVRFTLPKYTQLEQPNRKNFSSAMADIIVFANNISHVALSATLESYKKFIGLTTIYVIDTDNQSYETIVQNYRNCVFVKQNGINISTLLATILSSSASQHVILADAHYRVNDSINVSYCIQLLEQTFAHGFYLGHAKNTDTPAHTSAEEDVWVWQFKNDRNRWCSPYNIAMTLYEKKTIMNSLQALSCATFPELVKQLKEVSISPRKIGLFFKQPHTIYSNT